MDDLVLMVTKQKAQLELKNEEVVKTGAFYRRGYFILYGQYQLLMQEHIKLLKQHEQLKNEHIELWKATTEN